MTRTLRDFNQYVSVWRYSIVGDVERWASALCGLSVSHLTAKKIYEIAYDLHICKSFRNDRFVSLSGA